jgi:hypothetical protein
MQYRALICTDPALAADERAITQAASSADRAFLARRRNRHPG